MEVEEGAREGTVSVELRVQARVQQGETPDV